MTNGGRKARTPSQRIPHGNHFMPDLESFGRNGERPSRAWPRRKRSIGGCDPVGNGNRNREPSLLSNVVFWEPIPSKYTKCQLTNEFPEETQILQTLSLEPRSVVDIGCGDGRGSHAFGEGCAKRAHRISETTLVDISPDFFPIAERRLRGLGHVYGDLVYVSCPLEALADSGMVPQSTSTAFFIGLYNVDHLPSNGLAAYLRNSSVIGNLLRFRSIFANGVHWSPGDSTEMEGGDRSREACLSKLQRLISQSMESQQDGEAFIGVEVLGGEKMFKSFWFSTAGASWIMKLAFPSEAFSTKLTPVGRGFVMFAKPLFRQVDRLCICTNNVIGNCTDVVGAVGALRWLGGWSREEELAQETSRD